jgi:hypothetical protein
MYEFHTILTNFIFKVLAPFKQNKEFIIYKLERNICASVSLVTASGATVSECVAQEWPKTCSAAGAGCARTMPSSRLTPSAVPVDGAVTEETSVVME